MLLLIAFVGFVASEDFCQEFRRHGNKISYIYKQTLRIQALRVPAIQKHHIIIDGKYWNLEFDIKYDTIDFKSNESHSAPHFTDNYMGAACAWEGTIGGGGCRTLLLPKKDTHKWFNEISIENNTFDRVRNLDEYSEPVTRPVTGMQSDNYAFVYPVDYNIFDSKIWIYSPVIEFAIGSHKRFNRVVLTLLVENNQNNSINAIPTVDDPNNGSYFDHKPTSDWNQQSIQFSEAA